ncbi:fluoride efflux transporter FluC [Longirhabdus pacifica]|uniref:fluoride efflux transporter FluC n=1 Tax=Longirhabdus pacifica TaxID=2305227 RepID=UPI001008F250|nr:CrcB family protein [Longirhabdus pacifica]
MYTSWLAIMAGGFCGAISRYVLSVKISSAYKGVFPYGTLTVNSVGCFLLAFLWAMHIHAGNVWLFLGTGFMGAFTTFSTVHMEWFTMAVKKKSNKGYVYITLTYGLGIGSAFLGYIIGDKIIAIF